MSDRTYTDISEFADGGEGRLPGIDDQRSRRAHAEIKRAGDAFHVRDLGSHA